MDDQLFARVRELRELGAVNVSLSEDGSAITGVQFAPLLAFPPVGDGKPAAKPRPKHPSQRVDLRAWMANQGEES